MNKGKFDVRCHATWLTAKFIISFAQVMMKYKNETIKSDKMYTCVRLACTDPETRKPFAVFPNKDGNTRGKDKKDTSFSVSLKSFNEVLKNLGLDKYLSFHGNKGGTYSIGTIDLESLNTELYGKSNEPMDIVEALADSVRKTSLIRIKASQSLPVIENEGEKEVENSEPPKNSRDSIVLPGVEPAVTRSIGTPRQKKKDSPTSTSTRRSYSPKLLREARYIGILAKYGPKIKMKMDLREIVGILTNNYLLEFTDVFSNSQELKTRICSGKLSTVFSLASDSTIRYKAMGQGIVSFTELNMKYQMSNDIQEASLLVYDPHHDRIVQIGSLICRMELDTFNSFPGERVQFFLECSVTRMHAAKGQDSLIQHLLPASQQAVVDFVRLLWRCEDREIDAQINSRPGHGL